MKNIVLMIAVVLSCFCGSVFGASIVATVNGNPITDTDITARTKLMAMQGNVSTDNRKVALQNIIDDYVKLNYASNFGVKPSDKDVDTEFKRMGLESLSESEQKVAKEAIRANIAWQIIVARTVMPIVDVNESDLQNEKNNLARAKGLPIEMEIVRLVNIPEDTVKLLSKPKNCDDAVAIAQRLGGIPQRFTALQYELSEDIRERVVELPKLTWSSRVDSSVLLVCDTKKTKEYGNLDSMLKENAGYKQAMFMADQQLKQLRRKAVVVINDERYK